MHIIKKYKIFILLILIICPIILTNVTRDPIFLWDEGRNSLNALEMYFNNNFLVMHYNNEPDMWNTKPPMLIWFQTCFMYFIGVNELAIRLPSIIAAFFTCFYLFYFSKTVLKNEWLGLLISTILITVNGYVEIHGIRTGDFDALLTLYTTICSLSIFLYCESNKKTYLYLFFITLTCAALTKGIAGLLFAPAYILLVLFYKKFIPLIKNKDFYLGALIFIVFVFGYYGLREVFNPGYINAVYENELGGRLNSTLDGVDTKDNLFYFNNFFNEYDRLKYWIYLFPLAFILNLFNNNKTIFNLNIYCFTLIITHYLVLTKAATKYHWYDTPWFPFIAIIIGLGFYNLYTYLKKLKHSKIKYAAIILAFVISSLAYISILKKNTSPYNEYERNINLLSLFFKEARYGERVIEENLIYCSSLPLYNAMFYINQLNNIYNFNINHKNWTELKPGDVVIVGHDDEIKSNIENNFKTIILENNQQDFEHWGIKKYQIISYKN